MITTKEVLRLKQTRGAGIGFAKQIGLKNGALTAAKTLYRSKIKGIEGTSNNLEAIAFCMK